jgi:hypothetical protein
LAILPLLAAAVPAGAQSREKVREIGTLENGVYRHHRTGVAFTLPAAWTLVSQGRAGHGGHGVLLKDSVTEAFGWVCG